MLPVLQAERQLLAIEAASAPHMKADVRNRVLNRWNGRLRGRAKPRSAAEALATLPIPVIREVVEKDG